MMDENRAKVYFNDIFAGILQKDSNGYLFSYDSQYISKSGAVPISLTFPLRKEPFQSKGLFPFFKGLIPEGWLFELNSKTLKIDPNDDFKMLVETCRDCIGAVSIIAGGEN